MSLNKKQLTLRDMWYPESNDVRVIKNECSAHSRLLAVFKPLPKDLRKHIQSFHTSAPKLKCVDCGHGPSQRRVYEFQLSGCGLYGGFDGEEVGYMSGNEGAVLCKECRDWRACRYCNDEVYECHEVPTTIGKIRVCDNCHWQLSDEIRDGKLKRLVGKHGELI